MMRALPLCLLFAALQVSVSAFAQPQQPEPAGPAASQPRVTPAKKTPLEPADITTKATGQIELVVGRDSPIYAEFQGSPALTQRLREALQARGFELAPDAGSSKSVLQFRGDVVLMGGPKFHKGVKAPIGDATEKALKLAKESGQVTTADVVQTTAGVALNAAALNASLNNLKPVAWPSAASPTHWATRRVAGWYRKPSASVGQAARLLATRDRRPVVSYW